MAMQMFGGVSLKNTVSYAKAVVIWFTIIAISFSLMSFNNGVKANGKTSKDSLKGEKDFPTLVTSTQPSEVTITTVSLLETYPQAASFIKSYAAKEGVHYERMRDKAQPYFDMYDKILSSYGVPVELKYLSVIESNLQANAKSGVGAAGPWQFMPADAKRFGLKVSGKTDERRDFFKSTHAAAKYLKELYGRFGDWLLVVASYNCGPNKVQRLLNEKGGETFWDIQKYLPLETRNHVKKYISMQYIFEGDAIQTPNADVATLNS
jgi:membrane-bound lytic murein transglycosylase D